MVTPEDCILKADNYASAAMLSDAEEARVLIRLAAVWRNKALRLKLAERAHKFQIAQAGWSNADLRITQ